MIDMEKLFKSEGFNSLDDENKSLLKDFIQKAEGKSPKEAMPIFMEYYVKMKRTGKVMEGAQEMMIQTLKEGLTDEDRKKFEIMEMMFKGYPKNKI